MASVLPQQPDRRPLLMIVLPSLYGFFLIIYTLFVILCICRRSKDKSNKMQPDLERQNSSQQNNRHEKIKVDNIQDINNLSDSTYSTKNKNTSKDYTSKMTAKTRKRRSPLVVQQAKASENSYQEFRNIQELRSPVTNKNQQKNNDQQSPNLTYQIQQMSPTKRKLYQNNRNQNKSRKKKNTANKNLIYQQYMQ